jgi:hypothetical protein
LQPKNPFQGEYSTTITPALLAGGALPLPPAVHSVERDSQGRVREERAAGKYQVKIADGAKTEQEQHLINICDLVSQKLVRLDPLNKTAIVMGPRVGLVRPGFTLNRAPQPFCNSYLKRYSSMPRMQSEGWEPTISGVDAQGLRTWMVIRTPGARRSLAPS